MLVCAARLMWVAEVVTIEARATADLDVQLLGACAVVSGRYTIRPQVSISRLEVLPRSRHPASSKVFCHSGRVEGQLSELSAARPAATHGALLVRSITLVWLRYAPSQVSRKGRLHPPGCYALGQHRQVALSGSAPARALLRVAATVGGQSGRHRK